MSWHAAAVHLPLALALVWPVVDAVGYQLRRSDVSWTAVGLLVTATLTSFVATATGQAEYDAAYAAGFGVELLDTHADLASSVPWLLLGTSALRLWLPTKVGRWGHLMAIVLGLGVACLILRVGQTGGALVYEHKVGVSARAPEGP